VQQPPERPGTGQPDPPGGPTPEDPREREPIRDPPVHPEHDVERKNPVRQADPESDLAGEEPLQKGGNP